MSPPRRRFIGRSAAALGAWAGVVAQARAVAPAQRHGSLHDVRHVVVLTQENRSFDHLFGTLNGVRGFADPFPLPRPGGRTVWEQPREGGGASLRPWRLDTRADARWLRVLGTPHTWPDAQQAWDQGRLAAWPLAKRNHSMAHYASADLPLHSALADAFTLCDAYHCSFQGGTHPNRLMLMTGHIDPRGEGGGPALDNHLEDFGAPNATEAYHWTTYAERLQAAGVSWQVYQDLADNFNDNALASFRRFRDAYHRRPGHDPALRERGASSGGLTRLRADVLAGRLPAVSWIVGTAESSEHPDPSSPAQGAEFVAQVLQALTARPEVWASTVLFIHYDENDGWFDHVPPPAPPTWHQGRLLGASTVDTAAEIHRRRPARPVPGADLLGHPYGLGPRVPMWVVSPWSRGGWVCSETFDHTSVIRFLEARFGVAEPQISPWRRQVCGDLTRAFDFRHARVDLPPLPDPGPDARRARALPGVSRPEPPAVPEWPAQPPGARPARAWPQRLAARLGLAADGSLQLSLANRGGVGAVLQVVDRREPDEPPRRFTLRPRTEAADRWPADTAAYDLWVLGGNGWHRHFVGGRAGDELQVQVQPDARGRWLWLDALNPTTRPCDVQLQDLAYGAADRRWAVPPGRHRLRLPLPAHRWYDWSMHCSAHPGWRRRAAGHAENGQPSVTDPAMHGPATLQAWNGERRHPKA